MNASDRITTGHLANLFEDEGTEYEPLTIATYYVLKVQREAPVLWQNLQNDPKLSARGIGDYLFRLLKAWSAKVDPAEPGRHLVSFRNFAQDVHEGKESLP